MIRMTGGQKQGQLSSSSSKTSQSWYAKHLTVLYYCNYNTYPPYFQQNDIFAITI